MFVFVFYFQGVQGNSPILAGIKLAPLAIGMLISSPLAGIWADRRGSRTLAVLGMLVTAVGLALMTTLGRDTSYVWPWVYMFIVGVGSRHVQLAQHRGDDGRRRSAPPWHRRRRAGPGPEHGCGHLDRLRARRRHLVGAQERPVQGLLGPGQPHLQRPADPVHLQHAHRAVVPGRRSRWSARRSPPRGPRTSRARRAGGGQPPARAPPSPRRWRHERHGAERTLRIGELAELTGTTPRTIRYYEEIGLLGSARAHPGQAPLLHRGRRRAAARDRALRDLLGLSLEQLSQLLEAESARAHLRREYHQTEQPAERRRILEELQKHIGTQLELVHGACTS